MYIDDYKMTINKNIETQKYYKLKKLNRGLGMEINYVIKLSE